MRTTLSSGTPVEIIAGEDAASAERGLVVIPDIWGLRPLFVEISQTLHERTGWSVACFEPFPSHTLPSADEPDALAIRGRALRDISDKALLADAVESAGLTDAKEVGIVGFCMGGMYALKASATGRFDRVVSFYGMAHVQEAWQGAGQGDPIEALGRRGATKVMEIVGTEDPFLPPEHIEDLEQAGVIVHRYEGAGHGFVHDPSRPVHRADYAQDAWTKAIEFLGG